MSYGYSCTTNELLWNSVDVNTIEPDSAPWHSV